MKKLKKSYIEQIIKQRGLRQKNGHITEKTGHGLKIPTTEVPAPPTVGVLLENLAVHDHWSNLRGMGRGVQWRQD